MIVLVAGGSGFLGREVVSQLEKKGHHVIVHSRGHHTVPTRADAIVNCVGIIRNTLTQDFSDAHIEKTRWLVQLGKKLNIQQFVQVSAIGADLVVTRYQRTKLAGEHIVQKSKLPYAIIRPSVMWGDGDKSINMFRAISRTGFFPLLANGVVQPVHVKTVASLIVAAVERRIRDRVVEVGGPEMFSYRQLVDRIHPGVIVFRLPTCAVWMVTLFGAIIPTLPTPEMVVMLSQNNITKDRTVERLRIKNPRLR
jgi:uncharacterized protein YbjT (DUF2867 family)